MQPSFIRVEADEATYGLHIVLRFELEQEILDGRIALRELPDAWNDRFRQYFGLDVPNDALGVLQDIHWSSGMMGYFPTYLLGSIIACQIWETILADIPDLYTQFAAGEFSPCATGCGSISISSGASSCRRRRCSGWWAARWR